MDHVPDPTDFPPETNAPGLRRLDATFSCQICGELFDAPMTLGCGHTFCSMCVRRSLRDRHECPSCRSSAEEIQLVKNVQLEELCDSWRSARSTILRLVEKVDSLAKAIGSDANERPRKKRKVSGLSTSRPRSTPGPSSERDLVEVIDDLESGEEARGGDYVPNSDTEENEAQMQVERVVDCPMCGQSIITKKVNEHLDSGCKSFLASSKTKQDNTRNAWSNILGNGSSKPRSRGKEKQQREVASERVERLPKPSYSVLKDKKLREMLSEHQLPTTGSREQLIARHTQFVLQFNANLDRAEHLRRPVSELRRDLKKWEDNQVVKKVSVDDTKLYLKKRNTEFKRHVEAARASLKKRTEDVDVQSSSPVMEISSREGAMSNNELSGVDVGTEDMADRTVVPDSESEDIS